jgi:hypothetical protein
MMRTTALSLSLNIRRLPEEVRAADRDRLTQTVLAVRAVRRVRPDMTASDTLASVNTVRRSSGLRAGCARGGFIKRGCGPS